MKSTEVAHQIIRDYRNIGKQPTAYQLKIIKFGIFSFKYLVKIESVLQASNVNNLFLSCDNTRNHICHISQLESVAYWNNMHISKEDEIEVTFDYFKMLEKGIAIV